MITVSVIMITYRHEAFIVQAIEGVLMQQTSFDVELIIADDCSPDNTEEVVIEVIQTHPKAKWIKYTKHQANKGMHPNFAWALEQAQGKYVALCEGDDYWTDPLKLQKQVDFLEANLDYGLVHTDCDVIQDDIVRKSRRTRVGYVPNGFVFNELISRDFNITTVTVLAKKEIFIEGNHLLQEVGIKRGWKMGDRPIWLEASLKTKFGYLDEITSRYRIIQESASHSKNAQVQYEFIKSSFDVQKFFMERENVAEKIRRKVEVAHNEALLYFAFRNQNKKIAIEAYQVLQKIDAGKKKYKRRLLFLGAQNQFYWIIGKVYTQRKMLNKIFAKFLL